MECGGLTPLWMAAGIQYWWGRCQATALHTRANGPVSCRNIRVKNCSGKQDFDGLLSRVKRSRFVGARNPGITTWNRKPTEWALDAATNLINARGRSPAPRVPVVFTLVPRVSLRAFPAKAGFGTPLHPGLYSGRPHSRALHNYFFAAGAAADATGFGRFKYF